jgi:hypothetical protein
MSLKTLSLIAHSRSGDLALPNWVSEKNKTFAAYQYINKLKEIKLDFIAKHNKVNDYKAKGNYQITASEVARHIQVATTTLISTSAYSKNLKNYLDTINVELEQEKSTKLSRHRKTLSSGLRQHKKDEIRIELQNKLKELEVLKQKNAIEQATFVLRSLALPIKQKLGINV